MAHTPNRKIAAKPGQFVIEVDDGFCRHEYTIQFPIPPGNKGADVSIGDVARAIAEKFGGKIVGQREIHRFNKKRMKLMEKWW